MEPNYKPLYRSDTDRMVAGVCAGLAKYISMDPSIIRLVAVLLFFVTGPGILVAYLIMALIVPIEPTPETQNPQS